MGVSRRHADRRHALRAPRIPRVPALRLAVAIATTAVATTAILGAALVVAVARRVVTPPGPSAEPVRIIRVDEAGSTVTLSVTPDSTLPGRYGFWFDAGSGYARLGEVVGLDAERRTVIRQVLGVDSGSLTEGRRGRISGWFYRTPADLGLDARDVSVPTALGPAPAWLFPVEHGPGERWAVLVHGRGVTRAETLRAVPVLHRAGFAVLAVSWRNDGDAPRSSDGRYGMGATEWPDVEAAIRFATERGAREVVLMGWSMGGAICLELATRSDHGHLLRGIVLDSPVIDWASTLEFQAAEARIPPVVRRAALGLLGHRVAHRLTGSASRVNLDALDFVTRSGELAVPILVLHSDDDGYVPSTGSRRLAAIRPDLVTLASWSTARHTKLWNSDQDRYESLISHWVQELERSTRDGEKS